MRKYLLSIEEFLGPEGEALLAEALAGVDPHRRRKAEAVRPGRARAACVGAGLVLQQAVRDVLKAQERVGASASGAPPLSVPANRCLQRYGVKELLDMLRPKPPLPLSFWYGEKGKPYFCDYPVYFNLSHSGDYVLCVLSGEEVGADIQQHRAGRREGIARRFFSEKERAALESQGEDQDALFFRLWTRREAYCKLTGQGLSGLAGRDFLPEGESLLWEEFSLPGYSAAICSYGKAGDAGGSGAGTKHRQDMDKDVYREH